MGTMKRLKDAACSRWLLLPIPALLGAASCDMQPVEGEDDGIEIANQALHIGTDNPAWPELPSGGTVGNNLLGTSRLLSGKKANFPGFFGGFVYLFGNNYHEIYRLSSPTSTSITASKVKTIATGNTYSGCTPTPTGESNPPAGEEYEPWEAEGHQNVFMRKGPYTTGTQYQTYMAVYNGRGVNIINLTGLRDENDTVNSYWSEVRNIKVNKPNSDGTTSQTTPGACWGDTDNSVWGLSVSGNELWIGAANHGIHRVTWPSSVDDQVAIMKVSSSALSGMRAGPMWAFGDRLYTGTPKGSYGLASINISNPTGPSVISKTCGSTADCSDQEKYPSTYGVGHYWWQMYGDRLYTTSPLRNYQVDLANGTIGTRTEMGQPKIGSDDYQSEYVTFHAEDADGTTGTAMNRYAFIGSVRTNITQWSGGPQGVNGIVKTRMNTFNDWVWSGTPAPVHMDSFETDGVTKDRTDDQFGGVLNSMLFLCDEEDEYQNADGYYNWTETGKKGCWITRHTTGTDTARPGMMNMRVSPQGHMGFSLNEGVDIAKGAILVRKLSGSTLGADIPGTTSTNNHMIVNWGPDSGTLSTGTYYVKIDLQDFAGNSVGSVAPGFLTNIDVPTKRSYKDVTCHSGFGVTNQNAAYCFSFTIP